MKLSRHCRKDDFIMFFVIVGHFILIMANSIYAAPEPAVVQDGFRVTPSVFLAAVGVFNALIAYIYLTGQKTSSEALNEHKKIVEEKFRIMEKTVGDAMRAGQELIIEKINNVGMKVNSIKSEIDQLKGYHEKTEEKFMKTDDHEVKCDLKMQIVESMIADFCDDCERKSSKIKKAGANK